MHRGPAQLFVGAVVISAALLTAPALARAQSPADSGAGETIMRGCAECHGADGNSVRPGIPSLAGQPENFLTTQLILFREGLRQSELMSPQAEGLRDEVIVMLAKHFAGLAARGEPGPGDPALMAEGRRLAAAGRCGSCHLPDYTGRQQMPRLAGQREDYLVAALTAYRDNQRGVADTSMLDVMYGASDDEIAALAHFMSRQAPPKTE